MCRYRRTLSTCELPQYFWLVKVNKFACHLAIFFYMACRLYNNQINARALIGQSAMVYCAGELMEKSHVF